MRHTNRTLKSVVFERDHNLAVDEVNRQVYDLIAPEYASPSHHSCRNFDEANAIIISSMRNTLRLSARQLDGLPIAEVGPGPTPWMPTVYTHIEHKNTSTAFCIDISIGMISQCRQRTGFFSFYQHGSALSQSTWLDRQFGLVVACTCDPYLTDDLFSCVQAGTVSNGLFLLTWPSNAWSKEILREYPNMTTFSSLSGEKLHSYSFCRSANDVQISALKQGWVVVKYITVPLLSISDLSPKNFSIVSNGSGHINIMEGLLLKRI